jgi:hypothetical protein
MARDRTLIALALLIGCKSEPKSDPPPAEPPPADDKIETSPECAAKVKELAPWLEQLLLEQASHEIDFGYTLQIIDRTASPQPRKIDVLMITAKSFDGYDLNGTEHARIEIDAAPTQKALETKLAEMFATKPDPADKELPPPDLVRIDVDTEARWADVVRVVDAAIKAGYTRALFAFTATSKLEPPLGVALKITDADAISKANRRMEEMREKQCKTWDRAVMRHEWNPDGAANARASAKETADAIAACNCAADPGEVRVLKWIDSHWHQATIRVPIIVQLSGATPTEIPIAGKTPWSEAHAQLVAAAPDGQPPPVIRLVAK